MIYDNFFAIAARAFHFSFARTKEKQKQKENSPATFPKLKFARFSLRKRTRFTQAAFSF